MVYLDAIRFHVFLCEYFDREFRTHLSMLWPSLIKLLRLWLKASQNQSDFKVSHQFTAVNSISLSIILNYIDESFLNRNMVDQYYSFMRTLATHCYFVTSSSSQIIIFEYFYVWIQLYSFCDILLTKWKKNANQI